MSPCVGHWQLISELSHYSAGGPPESGDYIIEQDGDRLSFTVRWVKDGQEMETSFAAPADGSAVPADFPGLDSFSVTDEPDGSLSSEAVASGVVVSKALRRVSDDDRLMSVLQENADGQGGWIRIFQVYRRAG
ncbi:hypothetical protein [Psychromarinibacter sp. S121]|uniref:hypothetical protein n=1 Tax=Psychromarinibacter sp. S121 TaxID=3415127 RepID=UPI003C7EABC9